MDNLIHQYKMLS
jgi:exonuclease III